MTHESDDEHVANRLALQAERGLRPRRAARTDGAHDPTLREIGRSLVEGRWVIAGILVLALAAAVSYLYAASPVYRSSALLQFDEGPEGAAKLETLSALSPLFEPRSSAESELEILRSRSILGSVVDRLHLDIDARPRWFPMLGGAVARRHRGDAPAAPLLGLGGFAWGGERIEVRQLDVSEALVGEPLTLTALADGRFRVAGADGARLVEGEVGVPASSQAGTPRVDLLVSELVARPGTEFRIEKLRRDEIVDKLLSNLYVEERGKKTGVVVVELEGDDSARVAAVVTALCSAYLRHNLDRSQAEAARTLEFLETQLPRVKSNLEVAEVALNTYREDQKTADLSLETKATVDRAVELDRQVSELEMALTQLRQRYSERHPDVVALERQVAATRAKRGSLDPRIRSLPATQLSSTRLVRNVNVATELYVAMLNRAQELRVVKSGRLGNVHVIDQPVVAHKPLRPKPVSVITLALLLGVVGGVAAALGRRALDENADDPRDIEAGTGLPIFVTIPHSAREVHLRRSAGRGARVPLALAAPDDVAIENLRTLRTALGFVLKARGKVISVSSPSTGVGKTFVCANLGHLLAAAGQRVLLVDADLRRGALHCYFAAEPGPGLADVVSGEATLDEAIRGTGSAGLELLARGHLPSNPAELLSSPRLQELLATAAKRYDLLIIDTPPILAVTDALLVARHASVNLLVLRARHHPVPEIALALERFARSGVQVHGGILNDARPTGSGYGRVYEHRSSDGEGARAG